MEMQHHHQHRLSITREEDEEEDAFISASAIGASDPHNRRRSNSCSCSSSISSSTSLRSKASCYSSSSASSLRLIPRCSGSCLSNMASSAAKKAQSWLLEVEMGVVWGVAGVSIVVFVFLAIWFIDPALLTLVLQFRQARCQMTDAAVLVGISNCSWTSCRLGCTREIYKCWQVQVNFEFVLGTEPYRPPWVSLSSLFKEENEKQEQNALVTNSTSVSDGVEVNNLARLYPNVRGCGYPPSLDCDKFFQDFGDSQRGQFDCWVSTTDTSIAMTELDLDRAKTEVIYSLVPLFIFIIFILYAFCRLGVFSICNPLKLCPKAADDRLDISNLSPRKLFDYKKSLVERKRRALASLSGNSQEEELKVPTSALQQHRNFTPAPEIIEEKEEEEIQAQKPSEAPVKSKTNGSPKEAVIMMKKKLSKTESVPPQDSPSSVSTVTRRGATSRASLNSPADSVKSLQQRRLSSGKRKDSLEREILALDILDHHNVSDDNVPDTLKRVDSGASRSAWTDEVKKNS